MNLKQILAYKSEIIEIAKELGFRGLAIHNRRAPGMYEDSYGHFPLGFIATSGNIEAKVDFCALIGILLNSAVDIVIENPAGIDSDYLEHSVSLDLDGQDLENRLAKLFCVPLSDVDFTALDEVNKKTAEQHIKRMKHRAPAPMMFRGPQQTQLASAPEEVQRNDEESMSARGPELLKQ